MIRTTLGAVLTVVICLASTSQGTNLDSINDRHKRGRPLGSTTQCEDGWQYFTDYSGTPMCFRAVPTALPWKQAQAYCRRHVAHMLIADPISEFSTFIPQFESQEFLVDYLFRDTNGDFWSGMNVQSGRLMWDSYGPEYVRNKRSKSWVWAQGQPSVQETRDLCGHVTMGRRILSNPNGGSGSGTTNLEGLTTLPPPTTTVAEVFNGTNIMQLAPCVTALPFVCQKPVPRKEAKITSFCPDGWLGNQYLPYCFRITKDPVSLREAMTKCEEIPGGEIFQARPNTFNYSMATYVLNFYITNDQYFETRPVPNIWVDGGQVDVKGQTLPENQCYAIQEALEILQPAVVDCNKQLPFMCVRPTVKLDNMSVDITGPYLNQKEIQAFRPFEEVPITALIGRAPSDNEVIFIRTPTRYINSSFDYVQDIVRFTDRSFAYNVTQTDKLISPYEVNVWLPNSGSPFEDEVPLRRRRGAGIQVGIQGLKRAQHSLSHGNGIRGHGNKGSRYSDNDSTNLQVQLKSLMNSKKGGKKRKNRIGKKKRITDSNSNSNLIISYRDAIDEYISHDKKYARKQMSYTSTKDGKRNRNLAQKKEHVRAMPVTRYQSLESKKNHDKRLPNKKYFNKKGKRRVDSHNARLRETHKGSRLHERQRGKRSYRTLRGIPDILPPDVDPVVVVDYDQVRLTTGYYSFGIYTINPPSYIETEPVLVRYSERDWHIYVITVDLNPQEQFLSTENIASFNLYGDSDFVGIINEYAFSAMDRAPNLDGTVELPSTTSIRYYKAIPESITGTQVTFRAFMNVFYGSQSVVVDVEQKMLPVLDKHWKDNLARSGFLLDTIVVRSTVACPFEKLVVNGTEIQFPSTAAGEIAFTWERCFQASGAFASRPCEGDYDSGVRWGPITYNTGCQEFPPLNQSTSTVDLKILSEVDLNATNLKNVINDTITLTSPDIELTEADIIYTAEILYNLWQFEGAQANILDDVYDVANNVLERYPSIIDAAHEITNAANRIIESVEELTNNVNLFGDDTLRIVKSFLATDIWDQLGQGDLIIGLKLHDVNDDDALNDEALNDTDLLTVRRPSDADVSVTDTAIYLDEELIKDKSTRTVFQIYSKTSLFTVVNSNRFELISKIAAARLEIDGVRVTELGNKSVTAVFRPQKEDVRTVCAFWDYGANEAAGGWKTDGCTKTVMSDDRIECRCNHLTNFAVLIDLEAYTISDTDKLVLEVITKIGLIISVIGLGLTILTFLVFKHLRSGRGQQVLINLAVAMLCSSLIFLIGMDRTESKVGCKVVAALLHYFILVSFMWMLVEGVLQYLRFVKVLGTYIPKFMIKTMIPAWGIPIIPVVVVAAIDHELYYGGNGYCWLARDAMLYAFIIPVAVVLFANTIVFCLVLCNLFRRRSRGMKSNQSERKMAFLHFQAAVSIFVILGLTWVFGFLAIDGARVIFHYLFAIFNAFQGFFIFLLFTAREKQIRKAWKKLCCKESAGKATSSSTGTDVNRRKASLDTNSTGVKSPSSSGKSEDSYLGRNNTRNHAEFQNIGYEP